MIQRFLQCGTRRESDKVMLQSFAKTDVTPSAERVLAWSYQDELVLREWIGFELLGGIDGLRDDPDIGDPLTDRANDFVAVALFKIDIDVRMCCQERGQRGW